MENKVLQQGELDKIQGLREKFTEITNVLGNIEMQILNLQLEKESIKQELITLKQEEITLAENLKTQYGDGNISLETGVFTPFPNEEKQPVG